MNLGLCLPADWRTRWGWLRSWMKDTTRERHKGPFIMTECTAGNYWRSWVAVETFKHNLWASMYTVRLLYHRGKAWLEWNVCCLSNLLCRSPSVGASFHSINYHSGSWTRGRTIPWHLCLQLHRVNVFGLRGESGGWKAHTMKSAETQVGIFFLPTERLGVVFGLNYMMQWCKTNSHPSSLHKSLYFI